MLGKLVKDEFKSYRFSFGIIFLTAVIFTIFMKAICMIPYPGDTKAIVQTFTIIGYVFILVLMSEAAQVLVIIRFYSTMVGDRGYLTWTLPATSSTHLWSKLIGGTLWKLLAGIAMIILLIVFFTGNYWIWFDELGFSTMDLFIKEMIQDIKENAELTDMMLMILQLISGFIWSAAALLLVYMCIALGQLFGKWRILASVGFYFLIVIVLQVVSIIGVAFLSMITWQNTYYETSFIQDIGIILIAILMGIAVCAGLFAITNYIFKKHLNLE